MPSSLYSATANLAHLLLLYAMPYAHAKAKEPNALAQVETRSSFANKQDSLFINRTFFDLDSTLVVFALRPECFIVAQNSQSLPRLGTA